MTVCDAVSLTETQVNGLLNAYLERKKFEAKLHWAVLGEALNSEKEPELASLGQLAVMGFGIHGLQSG